MKRAYYSDSLSNFVARPHTEIRDLLAGEAAASGLPPLPSQIEAWEAEISILQVLLREHRGAIYLEFSIPRMGRRADVVLLMGRVVFVLEFKVGKGEFTRGDEDQVWDYALDLKNFHESSHAEYVVPVLVATEARDVPLLDLPTFHDDKTCAPIRAGLLGLSHVLDRVIAVAGEGHIDRTAWEAGRYRPTPTIIEAARALYSRHSVEDISRNDAGAINLLRTSETLAEIIRSSQTTSRKSICFVTGVPGAGKTLVGLNTATRFMDKTDKLYSVFLSGNGPLVKILCEALARDEVSRERAAGRDVRLSATRSKVKAFIQNVHQFRDDCLVDDGPPVEHVALFDEAQRAWNCFASVGNGRSPRYDKPQLEGPRWTRNRGSGTRALRSS